MNQKQQILPYGQRNEPIEHINFKKSNEIIISKFDFQYIQSWYLSPYNSFLLVQFESKNLQKLYKFENGSLIEYLKKDKNDNGFRNEFCSYCIFMKNTREFILLFENSIKCYQIEQNNWKTIQIIQQEARMVALKQDEKTLFTIFEHISVYTRSKQQTRNENWIIQFRVSFEPHSNYFFFDDVCNTISVSCVPIIIFKQFQNQKIMKLLKFKSADSILSHIQDEFIITRACIIQWNKQTRKMVRRSKIDCQKFHFYSFDKVTKLFLCQIEQQLCICKFINGKFQVIQNHADYFKVIEAKLGNNGLLLIKKTQIGLIINEQIK